MNTENKHLQYEVHFEDHSDFYKDPRIRPRIGTFATYEEAVEFAQGWVRQELDSLVDDPACFYIIPEPEGVHFDSHQYEETLRGGEGANRLQRSL